MAVRSRALRSGLVVPNSRTSCTQPVNVSASSSGTPSIHRDEPDRDPLA